VNRANDPNVGGDDSALADDPSVCPMGRIWRHITKESLDGATDVMGELPHSDGVSRSRLVLDLDLSPVLVVTRPQDTNLRGRPSPELGLLSSITEGLATTVGRVAQREPQSAIHVGKENGHLQSRLGNVLPKVVHVLRRPQGLRHDRARGHNAVVEYPKWVTVGALRVWPDGGGKSRWDGIDDEEHA